MTKARIVKYRFLMLSVLTLIWFLCFFLGVGVTYKERIYHENSSRTWFDLYIIEGWDVCSQGESFYDVNFTNIRKIFIPTYVIIFAILLSFSVVLNKLKRYKYSYVCLLGLLPFAISVGLSIFGDIKGVLGWGKQWVYWTASPPFVPVLGDWLSAIISLAMFGFSWLCNHWVKQGVPMPQPKERVLKERKNEKPKTDKQRIDELEKRLQELEGSKQD